MASIFEAFGGIANLKQKAHAWGFSDPESLHDARFSFDGSAKAGNCVFIRQIGENRFRMFFSCDKRDVYGHFPLVSTAEEVPREELRAAFSRRTGIAL